MTRHIRSKHNTSNSQNAARPKIGDETPDNDMQVDFGHNQHDTSDGEIDNELPPTLPEHNNDTNPSNIGIDDSHTSHSITVTSELTHQDFAFCKDERTRICFSQQHCFQG